MGNKHSADESPTRTRTRTASSSKDSKTKKTSTKSSMVPRDERKSTSSQKAKNDVANLDKMGEVHRKNSTLNKSAPKITPANEELIRLGFENPHSDMGTRIYVRVFEKRRDFQDFFDSVGRDTWNKLGQGLTEFMDTVVENIENLDEVIRLATEFGGKHVDLRQHGFKPDIWVTMADAMTTECIYLDQAVHSQTEVLEAYSVFNAIIFSAMRDGYYGRLRNERRASRRSSGNRQQTPI